MKPNYQEEKANTAETESEEDEKNVNVKYDSIGESKEDSFSAEEEIEVEQEINVLKVDDGDNLSSENNIEELLKTGIKNKKEEKVTVENEVKWLEPIEQEKKQETINIVNSIVLIVAKRIMK